jgi:hypothetical protein
MLRTIIILIAIALPLLDAALFRPGRRSLGSLRLLKLERLIYLFFLLAVAIQAVSSFGSILLHGRMSGWWHVLHMSVAGLFAVTLTAMALLWAEQSSFERGDSRRFYLGEKASFWLIILAGFVTLVSALLGMMSWFGSGAQNTLFEIHRYSALALVICALFNGYRVLLGRPGQKTPASPPAVTSAH